MTLLRLADSAKINNSSEKTNEHKPEQLISIYSILIQSVLEGNGIDKLTDLLAKLLKCTVVYEGPHLIHKTFSFFEDELAKRERLMPYLSLLTSPSFQKISYHLRQKQLLKISDTYPDLEINRIVSPILTGSEILGYLSLLRDDLPFSDLETSAVQHSVAIFAMVIVEERKIAEIELRLKGNFIEDLISGNYSDPSSIINRARALKYDITLPQRVLVVKIDNLNQIANRHDQNKTLQLNDLVKSIQSHLNLLGKGIVIPQKNNLIILVQQESADSPIDSTRELAETIIKKISSDFKIKLYIGIGSLCTKLTDFKGSFQTAEKALEIGNFIYSKEQVRFLDQFKVHDLFLNAIEPTELSNYAKKELGALLCYDKIHKTDLIPTLQQFLHLRNNIEGTAKSINISVSGLKYRLKRIEQIIGRDIGDYSVSFDLQLALIILQLIGEYKLEK